MLGSVILSAHLSILASIQRGLPGMAPSSSLWSRSLAMDLMAWASPTRRFSLAVRSAPTSGLLSVSAPEAEWGLSLMAEYLASQLNRAQVVPEIDLLADACVLVPGDLPSHIDPCLGLVPGVEHVTPTASV